MVDIRGIPQLQNEDTLLLDNVSRRAFMDVNIDKTGIDITHRTLNNRDAGIIVKFHSRSKRDIFLWSLKKFESENDQ